MNIFKIEKINENKSSTDIKKFIDEGLDIQYLVKR
jgi:hypothetical protein